MAGPATQSFLRKPALNASELICRQNEKTSAAEALGANAGDFDYLMRALRRRPEAAWPPRKLRARKVGAEPEAANEAAAGWRGEN